jgi:hypothetical protein
MARQARQAQRITPKAGVVPAVAAHQNVVAHRHAGKQRQVLKGAAHAQAGHAVAR